jgi:outer membrane protein TolC
MRIYMIAIALLAIGGFVRAEVPVYRLSLDDGVRASLAKSERLKAVERELEATRQKSAGTAGLLLPRLSIDGSYRYVTEVPEMQLVPGKPAVKFGDNENWSVGPSASWTLWDWGASWMAWSSISSLADAKAQEASLTRRQVRLTASNTYAQVQVALEAVRLLADSLTLAQEQYRDISLRLKAGTASKLDALLAHQDVLSRQREFTKARTALGASLQDLFALTGSGNGMDTSFPLDSSTAAPPDVPAPTLAVALDPMEVSTTALAESSRHGPDPGYPGVRYYERMADSSRNAANGVLASNLPALAVSAKASRDYPNGPVLEEINQRALVAVVSFPVFEWGRRGREEWEQREKAKSFDERRNQASVELARDWKKASDALAGLAVQRELNRQASAETQELARLTYEAYKTGQARFTEVQAANLRALEARVQEVRTRAETLVQLAVIRSLSMEE